MAERLNPADLEQQLLTFKCDPSKDWSELNVKKEYKIATGIDSIVLSLGDDEVAKIYKDGLEFLPQLKLYQDVTNTASELLEDEKYALKLHGINFRVLVNPILSIRVFENSNTLCAVSRRIHGIKLSSVCSGGRDKLAHLEYQLENELGVEGISISRGNINIKVFGLLKQPTLMITDLCNSIEDLKRK